MTTKELTTEEIQRVREWECATQGHTWNPLEMWQREIPVAFICCNCGKRIKVVEE